MTAAWIAAGVFLVTYGLIVIDRPHRTLSALAGGLAMILLGIVTQEQAFHAVDWNVIFLLVGMMVIASVISDTGFFQWVAVQAVRMGRGQPMYILILLTIVTAIASALLDNVTVVVLIAPVTLYVASGLGVSPIPFLIAEILASNIGGMATLIGDPPNILIGSAANIGFTEFAANLMPISILILLVFIAAIPWLFRNELQSEVSRSEVFDALVSSELITDMQLLRKSLAVLGLVLTGFMFHSALGLEPATVALVGATILMIWTRQDPQRRLSDVEWTTLFFFVGLFIAVEAMVEVGIIDAVAQAVLRLTEGQLPATAMLLLWFSALGSGIVDNIPYTAAVIPIVQQLGLQMPIEPLWWSLALGACLGGNVTLVGASANIVVANLAERGGHAIGFRLFLRYGVIVTFVSLILASLYVWLRYL